MIQCDIFHIKLYYGKIHPNNGIKAFTQQKVRNISFMIC